jgi:hypothetical protein
MTAIIGIIFFCLAIFFVLYFTIGEVQKDLKSKLNRYKNIELKLVSAGSTGKAYSEALVSINGSSFAYNGEKINADRYKFMVVDGFSMSRFGIKNGAVVLVDDDKSLSSKKDTVFVLNIFNLDKSNQIEYKLRKAIGFYDCRYENEDTFNAWIKNHPESDEKKLYEKYKGEKWKIDECKRLGCRLLISETTKDGKPYYSFHPETCIYGKVKYKIPKETVKIIEKR